MKKTVIGITGYARSGKDTFFSLLKQRSSSIYHRFAFADELKRDLHSFLIEKCGINIFDVPNEKKHIVRPILIAYGCLQRDLGDGLHWVRQTEKALNASLMHDPNFIPVITDVRFPNEAAYLKEKYNLILIEINRENCPTPPDEELKNQPLVREYVDHSITWPTVGEDRLHELNAFVEDFCKAHNLP